VPLVLPSESKVSVRQQRIKLLIVISGLLTIYLFGAYGGLLQDQYLSWWSDLAWTVASMTAGIRCLITAKKRQLVHERKAWYFFGFAALCWFVGMLVWDYYEVFGGVLVPFPSAADWFFMGYPIFFTIGLLYYRTKAPTAHYNMIQISNLGIIVSTIVVLCFIILSPAIKNSDQPFGYELFALSHAMLSIACFVFALYCYWFHVWQENRRSFWLLLAALVILAATDTLYAFQLLGESFDAASYLNIYWVLGFVLHYLAAFEQDNIVKTPSDHYVTESEPRSRKYEAIMPALCLFAVLVFTYYSQTKMDETIFRVLIFSGIAFAFFLTMREWYSNSVEIALLNEVKVAKDKLEERVRRRTVELSNAVQELESFSYSVSHDLRSPLRGINGFSHALLEDYADRLDDTGLDYLHRIRDGTMKMSELIDAMINLSRVSKHTLKKEQVSLSDLAESVVMQLQELEPERQVQVTIEAGITIESDYHMLRIILENLLGNAWKYTGKEKQAEISLGKITQGEETVIYVKDNGAGFDMTYADKLFGAFQRLHDNEFEGTGIGLATVLRCIRRLHGRIWAESQINKGATFYFTLPGM
jgi:signal transduction histidine kinase